MQRREAPQAYDCTSCKKTVPLDQRKHLRCGWIKGGVVRDEDDHEKVFGDWKKPLMYRGVRGSTYGGRLGPTTCPGYSCGLPQVIEVARAWGWEKRGSLAFQIEAREWLVTPAFLDLVDLFSSEQAESERWDFEQRHKKK